MTKLTILLTILSLNLFSLAQAGDNTAQQIICVASQPEFVQHIHFTVNKPADSAMECGRFWDLPTTANGSAVYLDFASIKETQTSDQFVFTDATRSDKSPIATIEIAPTGPENTYHNAIFYLNGQAQPMLCEIDTVEEYSSYVTCPLSQN
jgi:hypothetical protein